MNLKPNDENGDNGHFVLTEECSMLLLCRLGQNNHTQESDTRPGPDLW